MRIVARTDTLEELRDRGAVYVWPHSLRCCRGRQWVLDASTEPPDRDFEFVHAMDGFAVYATPGLRAPEELHLELDRRGRVRAFWNGQGWIG